MASFENMLANWAYSVGRVSFGLANSVAMANSVEVVSFVIVVCGIKRDPQQIIQLTWKLSMAQWRY